MLEVDWDRDGEGSKGVGGAQHTVGFGNFVRSFWSCSRWWDGRRWRWRRRWWRWWWRYWRHRRHARFGRLGRRWLYRARRVACDAMATLVCEPIGPVVPTLVAMTLDVLQPKLSGRGLHERGPCSLRFRGHFLVFFSAPDAGCDHSSVRRVIAHAHWACTAHGGYLCELRGREQRV